MDPITLIAGALVAGAATGATDAATAAVQDAYVGLRDLLRRRTGGDSQVQAALDGHDTESGDMRGRLEVLLSELDMCRDADELVAAAQQLMALVDPVGVNQGKYLVDLRDSKGTIVGDHAIMINRF